MIYCNERMVQQLSVPFRGYLEILCNKYQLKRDEILASSLGTRTANFVAGVIDFIDTST